MPISARGTVVLLGGGDPGGDLHHLVDVLKVAEFSVETIADVALDTRASLQRARDVFSDASRELPRILIGSGVGATAAASLAAEPFVTVEALVLANIVTSASRGISLPPGIALPEARSIRQPTLVFHGDADPVTDIADAANWATQLPRGVVRVVRGGGHGVLGGDSRRSVAASIVLFAERQRAGEPVLTDGFA